jgi:hypothetical protein
LREQARSRQGWKALSRAMAEGAAPGGFSRKAPIYHVRFG